MPDSLSLYFSPDTHQRKTEEKFLLKCLQLFTNNIKIFFPRHDTVLPMSGEDYLLTDVKITCV